MADAGKNLVGAARKIVDEMINYRPFYAVLGPPGSGKTTVAASAVEAVLRRDRSQRILVSAQSHFSLDNIGERIIKECKSGGVLAVRVAAGDVEDKVTTETMRRHTPQKLAEALVGNIRRTSEQRIRADVYADRPGVQRIIREWGMHAEASTLELKDRLRRGANVVFTTCLTATERLLTAAGGQDVCDLFDWVIVEEAAKAWPTELAVPLVRGVQWTLIGDHMQLPGFGADAMNDLLESFAGSKDDDLKYHFSHKDSYLRVVDMFRHLFDPEETPPQDGEPPPAGLLRPTGQLDRQFRMHRRIGDLVARFYKGGLESDPSAEKEHGLHAPAELVDHNLVWCDTSMIEDCTDSRGGEREPGWCNETEVTVIQGLVDRMRPAIAPPAGAVGASPAAEEDRLVILTPYRAQKDRLRAALGEHKERVFTVDAFQGKEADIVVVSLVRDNHKQGAAARIGHLQDPRRANVLLSRARRLLILVGSYDHFRDSEDATWSMICDYVGRAGKIIPAEILADLPLRRRTEADEASGGQAR